VAAQEHAQLVRTIYDAWNQRDFDRAASLAAETLELTNVFTGEVFHGPAGFRHFLQIWATAFPDG
jgi:dihydrodipicolinate synthase/N-acetylneuraminate lyase